MAKYDFFGLHRRIRIKYDFLMECPSLYLTQIIAKLLSCVIRTSITKNKETSYANNFQLSKIFGLNVNKNKK